MKHGFQKLFFALFLFVASFFLGSHALADSTSAPNISEVFFEDGSYFYIRGDVSKGSEVLVYLDGEYQGLTATSYLSDLRDQFIYTYTGSGLSAGDHIVKIVGRNLIMGGVFTKPAEITVSVSKQEAVEPTPAYSPTPYIPGKSSSSDSKVAAPDTSAKPATVLALPRPWIVSPAKDTSTTNARPVIIGLTHTNTRVHFYADSVYIGSTDWLTHSSGTANFAFTFPTDLSGGRHELWAVAEDRSGKKSAKSMVMNYVVETKMPAPTLLSANGAVVKGLSKNNSFIKIFVDGNIASEFWVKNDPSGTANFTLSVSASTAGSHTVYATATDTNGKTSEISNKVYFSVVAFSDEEKQPQTSSIDEENKSEEESADKAETADQQTAKEDDSSAKTDEKPEEKVDEKKNVNLDEILNKNENQDKEKVDNNNDNQDTSFLKSKLNLIIFLAFLLGVIAWIFWVNRELVKESKKQKEQEDKTSEEKKDEEQNNQ